MREVQTLSRLNHQHIIRYYQAWLEEVEEENENVKCPNFHSIKY